MLEYARVTSYDREAASFKWSDIDGEPDDLEVELEADLEADAEADAETDVETDVETEFEFVEV